MTETETTTDTDLIPLEEVISRNVKAEIVRAGYKYVDVEAALGISHAYANRRSNGEQEWKPSEVDRIATWLGVDRAVLLDTTR